MKSEELNVTKAMIILNTKHPSASSNVNEVIRTVLNSLFFPHQKHQKHKSTKTQPSKSTKRYKETKMKNALKSI